MFEYWLTVDERACWNKLINALEEIGQNALAANIKQNILKGNFIVKSGACQCVPGFSSYYFHMDVCMHVCVHVFPPPAMSM